MSRELAALAYIAAAGGTGVLLATVAALPLHGTAQGLAFIAVALSFMVVAGACTPRRYTITSREDRS